MANEAQRRQWNDRGMIERWKRAEPSTAPVLEPLMAAVAPRAGEHLLDIGCGGGLTTVAAGQMVGSSGSATGADLSEGMHTLAVSRAAGAGLANVRFIVADAQESAFPGGPFDVAMSRFGVMFFADPVAAFTNIARHLKDGGRIVFAAWQEAHQNTWSPREVLARYAPPSPRRPGGLHEPGPFAFGDAAYVERILESAGFSAIRHTDHEYEWSDPVGGPLYDPAQFGPMRLDEQTLQKAIADLRAAERAVAKDGVVLQHRRYRIFRARK